MCVFKKKTSHTTSKIGGSLNINSFQPLFLTICDKINALRTTQCKGLRYCSRGFGQGTIKCNFMLTINHLG